MSAWTWVLIALSVAGAGLALASLVVVLLTALRVRAKMQALAGRPLFLSLESLQLQSARLSQLAPQMEPLAARSTAAVASIQESARILRLTDARAALETAGAELRALVEDLG